ncbi:MAG: homoserine dehydrogenase [Anaerolineae bacterium]|jgi:homoserine dehydrogenase|nr:homoserine dehydrogenase [Anaerolineae bacterium]
MQDIRFVLIGLGNLGRRFCEILQDKDPLLRERYGLALHLVGASDSRGVAYDPQGLELGKVARLKREGGTIADYPGVGRRDWDAPTLVANAEAELLLEASPVNLQQGAEPALTCIRTALKRGMNVVTPNKGPLVMAYQELHALAQEYHVKLRFDGTVAGGLPAINLGHRDLRGAVIERLEAVPNLVTGYVMDMLTDGLPWEDALHEAYAAGVLEGDGTWDLDGWDPAAKLTILANATLGYPARLDEVARAGVRSVSVDELQAAREHGERYRLLAKAERRSDGTYALSVTPTSLAPDHPLGHLGRKQMGVVFTTDIYGTITAIIDEPTPIPSAATMLRDLIDVYVEA